MVQRNQYRLGRNLAIEFLKTDRDQIRDWRNRGLITRNPDGTREDLETVGGVDVPSFKPRLDEDTRVRPKHLSAQTVELI